MNFVDYWADFVRNNDDEIWSKQQNKLIDSQIQSSREFFRELFKEDFEAKARKYMREMGKINGLSGKVIPIEKAIEDSKK